MRFRIFTTKLTDMKENVKKLLKKIPNTIFFPVTAFVLPMFQGNFVDFQVW